jgi:hypothetical protein
MSQWKYTSSSKFLFYMTKDANVMLLYKIKWKIIPHSRSPCSSVRKYFLHKYSISRSWSKPQFLVPL